MQPKSSSLETATATILDALREPFERQMRLGQWTVDFYIPRINLVIECDGSYWHSLPKVVIRDREKNAWLSRHGHKILRLSESVIRAGAATGPILEALSS